MVQDPGLNILKIESGKQEAFTALVKEYQHRVYGIVRKMVIDHDDTDDIVQEVFIKVWQGMDKFKGESAIFTWIYRIATNESLMFLRKRRRFWMNRDVSQDLINNLTNDPFLDADEVQMKLQKAILLLPDKQRLVFHLKYYEELKYDKIAEITNSTLGSLKASYHHAVKKIEEFLKKD